MGMCASLVVVVLKHFLPSRRRLAAMSGPGRPSSNSRRATTTTAVFSDPAIAVTGGELTYQSMRSKRPPADALARLIHDQTHL